MQKDFRLGRRILFGMVFIVAICCIGFLACGGSGNTDADVAEVSATPSPEKKDVQSEQNKSHTVDPSVPAGWTSLNVQGWSIAFPSNWNGDEDAGVWWPGEGNMNMGRPPVSVHRGGIPLMPNTAFEDRVKTHIHGEPMERKNVSVSGLSGFSCSWEFQGNKHLGIFLEEKVGSGVGVIHFVDCQAPMGEFDENKDDFEKIITSLKK